MSVATTISIPGSWQSRYALAACRDGIVAGDRSKFEPDAVDDSGRVLPRPW